MTNIMFKNAAKTMCLALSATAFWASCTDYDWNKAHSRDQEYTQAFTEAFGEMDPDQTWNTLSKYTAEIVIGNYLEDLYKVAVYLGDPRTSEKPGMIAFKEDVEDNQTVTFTMDAPQGTNKVYVAVYDNANIPMVREVSVGADKTFKTTFGTEGTRSAKWTNDEWATYGATIEDYFDAATPAEMKNWTALTDNDIDVTTSHNRITSVAFDIQNYLRWRGVDKDATSIGTVLACSGENTGKEHAEDNIVLDGSKILDCGNGGPGQIVFGDWDVHHLNYIDLRYATGIAALGTPGIKLRFIFNRAMNKGSYVEKILTLDDNGFGVLDLSDMNPEYIHLNAVKMTGSKNGAVKAMSYFMELGETEGQTIYHTLSDLYWVTVDEAEFDESGIYKNKLEVRYIAEGDGHHYRIPSGTVLTKPIASNNEVDGDTYQMIQDNIVIYVENGATMHISSKCTFNGTTLYVANGGKIILDDDVHMSNTGRFVVEEGGSIQGPGSLYVNNGAPCYNAGNIGTETEVNVLNTNGSDFFNAPSGVINVHTLTGTMAPTKVTNFGYITAYNNGGAGSAYNGTLINGCYIHYTCPSTAVADKVGLMPFIALTNSKIQVDGLAELATSYGTDGFQTFFLGTPVTDANNQTHAFNDGTYLYPVPDDWRIECNKYVNEMHAYSMLEVNYLYNNMSSILGPTDGNAIVKMKKVMIDNAAFFLKNNVYVDFDPEQSSNTILNLSGGLSTWNARDPYYENGELKYYGYLYGNAIIFVEYMLKNRIIHEGKCSSAFTIPDSKCVPGGYNTDSDPDPDPEPDPDDAGVEYILAFEDLGASDDFDFNDIVFSVKHVAGQNTATVRLLAGGGTLEANILYNGKVLNDWTIDGTKSTETEVHRLFGVPTKTMVNTYAQYLVDLADTEYEGATVTKKITTVMPFAAGATITDHAKYFGIRVVQKNGTTQDIYFPDEAGNAAPQGILIDDPNWMWPTERTNIKDAYPNFIYWVGDKQDHWYDKTWQSGTTSGVVTSKVVNITF